MCILYTILVWLVLIIDITDGFTQYTSEYRCAILLSRQHAEVRRQKSFVSEYKCVRVK